MFAVAGYHPVVCDAFILLIIFLLFQEKFKEQEAHVTAKTTVQDIKVINGFYEVLNANSSLSVPDKKG